MIVLAIRAFFQIRKYFMGTDSGAFLVKFLFDWFFVGLFFFTLIYSNRFPSLQDFDINMLLNVGLEDLKNGNMFGVVKIIGFILLWSAVVVHISLLTSILARYIMLSSFSEPDINRFIKFVDVEIQHENWKKVFNHLKAKWTIVQSNSILLSYLGDAYNGLNKYEEAVGAYEESLEFATNDSLKVAVTLKAADISFLQLKDVEMAIELIDETLRQPLEESEYKLLEDKKKEILSS
ncbi:MAG: hypothetical protein COA79_12020 [Planctomycetota bacterium]|nr:MAG: hypothetical protein COA79_12020 [Planctomycetota bacterium]